MFRYIGLNVLLKWMSPDFSGGTVYKNLPTNAGDTGLIPGPRKFQMLRSN